MRHRNGPRWVVQEIEMNLYLMEGSYVALGRQDPLPAIQDDVFVVADNLLSQALQSGISYGKNGDEKEVQLRGRGFSEFTSIGVPSLRASCTRVLSVTSTKSDFFC